MASVGTAKEWKSHVWVVTKGSRPLALDLGEKLTFEGPGDGGTESVLKASGKKLGDQWRYDPRAGRVDLYVGVEPYTAEHDGEANPPTLTFRSAVAKGGDLGSGFWMAEEAEQRGRQTVTKLSEDEFRLVNEERRPDGAWAPLDEYRYRLEG